MINRLEDTFVLWKTVCSSKLLTSVQLVRQGDLLVHHLLELSSTDLVHE